jgi:tetratricopeptide (TPR) repeat protein
MKKYNIYIFIIIAYFLLSCANHGNLIVQDSNETPKVSFKAREYFLKGIFLQAEERFSEALVQFHKAQIFDTTSATIHNSLAENYLKLNEFEPALFHLKKALVLQPENLETYQLLGEIYFRQQDDDKAIAAYKKVLALDPFDDNARNFLFFLYEKTKKPEAKALLYEELLKLYGKNKLLLEQIVEFYQKQKDYPNAIKYIDEIITLDSTNARYYFIKGQMLENIQKIPEAIGNYEKVLEYTPDEINAIRKLAFLYRSENQHQKVIDLYLPFLESNPDDMIARLSIAESFYFLDKFDKSRELLLPIENQKNNPWGVNDLLGRVELEEKNFDKAIYYFSKVIEHDKKNRFGWLFLGFTYSDKGDLPNAEKTYRQAVTYLPQDATLWSWLGIVLQRQNKFAESIEPYQKAIILDPKNINALSSLPVVLEGLNLFSQSDSVYEAGLKNLPENALLLNNYAYSLSERNLRLDEALKMAQKAIEIEQENGAYLDTIGWIYFKLNQLSEAEHYILKSLQLRPNSPVVLDHMGDVYFNMDNIEKAKTYWKKSIELAPDNQLILDKIANN